MKPKTLTPLLLNLLIFPGSGTLLAKRWTEGALQITITLTSLAMLGVGGLNSLANLAQALNSDEIVNQDPTHILMVLGGGIGILAAYIWGAFTIAPKSPPELPS